MTLYDANDIKTLVQNKWALMYPSLNDLYLQLDEYTPLQPDYQIVFINSPERVMFVAPNVIKHEMDVTLQVYQKLPHYQNDDIETTYRPRQLAMKDELTRIMNTYRFNTIAQGVTINHSSWRDSKFPHGLGSEAEPISFLSTMFVQIHWYEVVSGDATEIGIRVAEVSIMGGDLLGVMGVDWKDTDPWVMLQVPKGPVLEQHLLGPHVEGTITCHDYHSIYTQLQTIPITIGGTQYPVNIDSSKTVFNTVNNGLPEPYPQFSIFMEDAYGDIIEYQVVNARIRNIELTRATTTGMSPISWTIRWMADYLYVLFHPA